MKKGWFLVYNDVTGEVEIELKSKTNVALREGKRKWNDLLKAKEVKAPNPRPRIIYRHPLLWFDS